MERSTIPSSSLPSKTILRVGIPTATETQLSHDRQLESLYLPNAATSLSNVEVRYAGNAAAPGHQFEPYRVAAVHVSGGGSYSIDRLRITNAENNGILLQSNATLQLTNSQIVGVGRTSINVDSGTVALNNSIFEGGNIGVRVTSNGIASGSGNAFLGFSTFAVQNTTTDFAKANFEGNWWGHALGPNDSSAADGNVNSNPSGQPVSDYVRYANWLATPPIGFRFGPRISSAALLPSGDAIIITFENPIQASTFASEDVSLTGTGAPAIASVTPWNAKQYRVGFSSAITTSATLLLTIGPNVLSLGGVPMDGDEDGIAGEPNDAFTQVLTVDRSGPRAIASSPIGTVNQSLSSITVTFNEPIDVDSLNTSRASLGLPTGGTIPILAMTPLPGNQVRFTFEPQSINGIYTLTVEPSIRDLAGNSLDQNSNGINGEEPDDRFITTVTVARDPLRVLSIVPSIATNDPIERFDITFSAPINAASFTTSDITIQSPIGPVNVLSVNQLSDTQYRVLVTRSTADGDYTIAIGPAINDIADVAMDQDGDGIPREFEDRFVHTVRLAGVGPQVTSITPRDKVAAPVSFIDVTFSEPILASSVGVDDLRLLDPQGNSIPILSISPGLSTFRFQFASQSTEGVYTLSLGPGVADLGGAFMDQDRDGQPNEPVDDVFTSSFTVDATGAFVVSAIPAGG